MCKNSLFEDLDLDLFEKFDKMNKVKIEIYTYVT